VHRITVKLTYFIAQLFALFKIKIDNIYFSTSCFLISNLKGLPGLLTDKYCGHNKLWFHCLCLFFSLSHSWLWEQFPNYECVVLVEDLMSCRRRAVLDVMLHCAKANKLPGSTFKILVLTSWALALILCRIVTTQTEFKPFLLFSSTVSWIDVI